MTAKRSLIILFSPVGEAESELPETATETEVRFEVRFKLLACGRKIKAVVEVMHPLC